MKNKKTKTVEITKINNGHTPLGHKPLNEGHKPFIKGHKPAQTSTQTKPPLTPGISTTTQVPVSSSNQNSSSKK